MSDANVAQLHGHLADLDGEDRRQQSHGKQILEAATQALEKVTKRLGELTPMVDSAEYQKLLEDKGILEQVIQTRT